MAHRRIQMALELARAVTYLHSVEAVHRQITLDHVVFVNALVQDDPPLDTLRQHFDITRLTDVDFGLTKPAHPAAEAAVAAAAAAVADAANVAAAKAAAPSAANTPLSPPNGTRVVLTDLQAMVSSQGDPSTEEMKVSDLPEWSKASHWFGHLFNDENREHLEAAFSVVHSSLLQSNAPPLLVQVDRFALALTVLQLMMGVSFDDATGTPSADCVLLVAGFRAWTLQVSKRSTEFHFADRYSIFIS